MPHWCLAVEWLRIKVGRLSWSAFGSISRSLWPHTWVGASSSSENSTACCETGVPKLAPSEAVRLPPQKSGGLPYVRCCNGSMLTCRSFFMKGQGALAFHLTSEPFTPTSNPYTPPRPSAMAS